MLVEVLHHRRVGQRMIALERQQIIAPARQYPLGNRGLTSHGVQGDNAVRQDQLVQQFGDGGGLVRLAIYAALSQHEALAVAQALTTCRGTALARGQTSAGSSCRRWPPPRAQSRP